jgi:hypothetical protein
VGTHKLATQQIAALRTILMTPEQIQAVRDLWDACEPFLSVAWEDAVPCSTCEGTGNDPRFPVANPIDCSECGGGGREDPPLQLALDAICDAFPHGDPVRLEPGESASPARCPSTMTSRQR